MNPKIDFSTFVLSISSAAFMGLGLAPRPGASQVEVDLNLARQNIDLLELIKDKTRNNLSGEEFKLLERLLNETRLRFVEVQEKEQKKKR